MNRLIMRPLALSLGALASAAVLAQPVPPPDASPDALRQRSIDTERRILEEQRRRDPVVRDPIDADAIKPPVPPRRVTPSGTRFRVQEIRFSASELLSAQELVSIAAEFEGKEQSFAELQALIERVNALYKSKGIITAAATIPSQEVVGGVVNVRLVEGRVGRLAIEGNNTTDEDYVRNRIAQRPAALVDLATLESDLQYFNRTHDAQIRAELEPGRIFGTTDVVLKMLEPSRHSLGLYVGNAGSPSTGEYQGGLVYTNRSLFGFRDDLVLSAAGAEGHRGYAIAYSVPVNRFGGRLSLGHYDDRTKVVHGAFKPLGIESESVSDILSFRQPLLLRERERLSAVLSAKKRVGETLVSGTPLQGTSVLTYVVGLESSLVRDAWILQANASRAEGHESQPTERPFHTWRGTASALREISPGYSARAAFTWQAGSSEFLPTSEQHYLGGDSSVRGYTPAFLVGTKGYAANFEFHFPLVGPSGNSSTSVSGLVFHDVGSVSRPPGTASVKDRIASVGAGVSIALERLGSLRIAVGFKLNDRPEDVRAYRIHFQLVSSPF
ncbi:MAG TPA: ShlB/FhaC/HecB family hemolysin secretion/activation protein [Planctomycetaceae bacterium]|nr:ShlB/FhaC/HecB family hemolysin secretion/activation protein [Planctomycetaceae bacterium]